MKMDVLFLSVLALAASSVAGEVMKPSVMESVSFLGRWDHRASGSCASAPGALVKFNADTKSVTFDLEGYSRWRFDVDGKSVTLFETNGRATKKLGAVGDGKIHTYRLVKISESNPGEVCVHDISLGNSGKFGPKPAPSNRRIEFIGDSFTVGFGNEGTNTDPAEMEFEKTDASKSYAFILADNFKADFQVNAVSGRGLVRNYANIAPGWTLAKLYDYAVPGIAATDSFPAPWDLNKFHPQVIVLFMGINDFQGDPPYADKRIFKIAYARFLDKLREAHPGVKFLLLSTKVWPNDDLTPTVQEIYDEQVASGHKDLEFKALLTENVGLLGHPDVRAHQEMANTIRPIIGRLGGWLGR